MGRVVAFTALARVEIAEGRLEAARTVLQEGLAWLERLAINIKDPAIRATATYRVWERAALLDLAARLDVPVPPNIPPRPDSMERAST